MHENGTFSYFDYFKDTHREKALSNKTPALAKSRNIGVWVAGTSIFTKVVTGKTPLFVIVPFCTHHSIMS